MNRLEALIGRWSISAKFPGAPSTGDVGSVAFAWLPGQRFLIQRWEAPDPAPDGIAIIGFDEDRGHFLQHYFDSRGVARLYEMSLDDGEWRLWRDDTEDFSQRFTGAFGDDGMTITAAWEKCLDGSSWEHDFELTYTRVE